MTGGPRIRRLRRHAPALALAALSGLIGFVPHLRHPDSPYLQPDENSLAGFVETVRGGRWDYSDNYVWEHRHDAWPYLRLPYWILGSVARLTGTPALFRWADALLPPLTVLLCTGLLRSAGLSRGIALVGAAVTIFPPPHLVDLIEPLDRYEFWRVMKWRLLPFLVEPEMIGGMGALRLPDPLFSRLFLLAAAWGTVTAVRRGGWARLIGAGLLCSSTVYLRFYDWTILLPTLGFAALHLKLLGRRPEASRTAVVLAVGLAAASPYFVDTLGPGAPAAGVDFLSTNRYVETHRLFPDVLAETYPLGPLTLAALFVGCLALSRRVSVARAGLWLCGALMLAVSHQVVTGWTIAPDHWYHNHVFPLATTAQALAAAGLAGCVRRTWLRRGLLGLLLGGTLLFAGDVALRTAPADAEAAIHAEIRAAVSLARSTGPEDPVILTWHPAILREADGHAWSFLPWPIYSTVGIEEALERLFLACRLLGMPESEMLLLFDGPGTHPFMHAVAYGDFMHFTPIEAPSLRRGGLEYLRLPESIRERWMTFYRNLPETPVELRARIRSRFRLDYVLWTPALEQIAGAPRLGGWEEVHRTASVVLYRLP